MLGATLVFSLFYSLSVASFIPELATTMCTTTPDPEGGDDPETIVSTFGRCSRDSTIVFTEGTFHIEKVMLTTGLQNVKIDMNGTLFGGRMVSQRETKATELAPLMETDRYDTI
ncbi:hypothetical protein ACEPAH_2820 [Sanghuangporus vaninii]